MFPNTTPLINGPSAPTQGAPSFTQAANYMNPGLSATQMMQSSPYTQYQQATQAMQQQLQNMKMNSVGAMAQPQGQGGQGQGGMPSPFPMGMGQPQQPGGGY